MSAKREKKRRYNRKLEFIAAYDKWLAEEPPVWRFIKRKRWKQNCPDRKWYQ